MPKVTLTLDVPCCSGCPCHDIDGGPGPVMVCNHPRAPDHGYIISHPECDTGFPQKCPFREEGFVA